MRSGESPGRLRRSRFYFLSRNLEYKQDLIQHGSTQHRETATLLITASLCSHLKQPALGYTPQHVIHTLPDACLCLRGRGNRRDPSHLREQGSLWRHSLQSQSICNRMLEDLEGSVKENRPFYLVIHKNSKSHSQHRALQELPEKQTERWNKSLLQKWQFDDRGSSGDNK